MFPDSINYFQQHMGWFFALNLKGTASGTIPCDPSPLYGNSQHAENTVDCSAGCYINN
jgi:hypothetical protein